MACSDEEQVVLLVQEKIKMYRLGCDDGYVNGLKFASSLIERTRTDWDEQTQYKELILKQINHLIERLEGTN